MRFTAGGSAANVILKSLSFGYIATGYSGTNGNFFVVGDSDDSGAIGASDGYLGPYSASSSGVTLPGNSLLSDDIFGVLAGKNASWKLKSVTVDYTPPPPNVVPLPAGAVLLLSALGGLGIARRRKKAA